MEQQITITADDLTWGESTLALWQSPPKPDGTYDRWTPFEAQNGARAALRLAIAAEEMLAAARGWQAVKSGQLTPEALLGSLGPEALLSRGPKIGAGQKEADELGEDIGRLYRLAQGEIMGLYRGVRLWDGYILKSEPPDLGAVSFAIVVVGAAALVVGSWLVSREVATAWRTVETERAWSAAKAYAEITTNKALIAAGQKPIVSDWAKLRSAGAEVQESKWTHFAAGAGVGAIGLIGAYYGLTKIGERRSRPRLALRRANPAPRRVRRVAKRRRNQQQAFDWDESGGRQLRVQEYAKRKAAEAKPKPKPARSKKAKPIKLTKRKVIDAAVGALDSGLIDRLPVRHRYQIIEYQGPAGTLTASPRDWEQMGRSNDLDEAQGFVESAEYVGKVSAVVDTQGNQYMKNRGVVYVGYPPSTPSRTRRRRNPAEQKAIHRLGTDAADRAVDAAITAKLKRWPTKPPPSAVDELARAIGHWPGRDEWRMYELAWREQVQTRKLAAAENASTPTVRANPLRRGYSEKTLRANIAAEVKAGRTRSQAAAIAYRSARQSYRKRHPKGPFPAHLKRAPSTSTRKRTSPKGRTRGTLRGKRRPAGGRRSATV